MKKRVLLLCLALFVLTGGCFRSSPPVNYYVLASPAQGLAPSLASSANNPLEAHGGQSALGGVRVGVLPIMLPGYLQRRQMVIRYADNVDIEVRDFQRWGEDLGEGMARVISASMTRELKSVRGVALPLRTGAPVDLRVQVEVRRFEGCPEGSVILEALWNVQKAGEALREGYFRQEGQAGPGMPALVQVQSELVSRLGRDMAGGVLDVLKKQKH